MIEIKSWNSLSAPELKELKHFKSVEVAGPIIVNDPNDEVIIMRNKKDNNIVAFCLVSKTHPDTKTDDNGMYIYNTYGNRLILVLAFELYDKCRLHELRTDIDTIKLWIDHGGKIAGLYKKPTVDMRCIEYVTLVFTHNSS